jgi:hypothetical protein
LWRDQALVFGTWLSKRLELFSLTALIEGVLQSGLRYRLPRYQFNACRATAVSGFFLHR